MERVSVRDERIIAAQIGRRPRGLSAVARRCSFGFPQVVRVHPVVDGKPFPTLYWLTCPWVSGEIDRIEASGGVGAWEARLAADEELAAALERANRAYIEERRALLSDEEARELRGNGMLESLENRGIGGIADLRGLKCLHLHVAHALASRNPIGERVLAELSGQECDPKQVICSALVGAEQIGQINR